MCRLQTITWDGYEFLEHVRSDTVWDRTTETLAQQGVGMAIDVIRSVDTQITLRLIGGG